MTDVDMLVHHGDCIEIMRSLPDASVDAIVTDPPYGLGFMGKAWDDLPPSLPWAQECLRVLKPGGHLLAFGGSRTWHRLAVAIEDAGFELRDSIAWLYGSGFPKSLDVSKAIDKAAGAEREVTGLSPYAANRAADLGYHGNAPDEGLRMLTAPATPDAERWQGWGTALKPSFEPIVVGRKPLTGTVAANVLEHGTGALNIDACRAGDEVAGRWPTNVVLDGHAADALDEQSGVLRSGEWPAKRGADQERTAYGAFCGQDGLPARRKAEEGGASRFFPTFRYQAKAPARERPKVDGVAHPTVKPLELMRWLVRLVTPPGGIVLDPFAGSGTTVEAALLEGMECIAIEREASYLPLIQARIERALI